MIGVIADDLTGAAEIGAVGLRHGLRAEVLLQGQPSREADLVCLDTDSRACSPGIAARRVAQAARLLRQAGATWIYKKTDSLLRGNVTPELEAVVAELAMDGALLVSANPSLGRTISGGRYFVDGNPIHETGFAQDPGHPRSSSSVRDLIGLPAQLPLFVLPPSSALPARGLVIGEAASSEHICTWASRRKENWLMAGGAQFFSALLRLPAARTTSEQLSGNQLFVCGSVTETTRSFVTRQAEQGVPVFPLPAQALSVGWPADQVWLDRLCGPVAAAFQSSDRVVLHVGLPLVTNAPVAEMLSWHLTLLAKAALNRIGLRSIGAVFAEGGATAAALAQQMGWKRMRVQCELAPGVVGMAPDKSAVSLVIKPGSYAWPESLSKGKVQPLHSAEV